MRQNDGLQIAFRLLDGEVRHVSVGTHSGSVGNALDRLQDWIETDDGTWIQKRFIVEATVTRRAAGATPPGASGATPPGASGATPAGA